MWIWYILLLLLCRRCCWCWWCFFSTINFERMTDTLQSRARYSRVCVHIVYNKITFTPMVFSLSLLLGVCVYVYVHMTYFLEIVRAHLINTNSPKWPSFTVYVRYVCMCVYDVLHCVFTFKNTLAVFLRALSRMSVVASADQAHHAYISISSIEVFRSCLCNSSTHTCTHERIYKNDRCFRSVAAI